MIRSLAYVVAESADLTPWRSFACDTLGLMEAEGSGRDQLRFRLDDRPFRFVIERGQSNRFVAAGWELESADAYRAQLTALREAGVTVVEASKAEAKSRSVAEMARCVDPSENGLELHWGRVVDYRPFASPAGVTGFKTGDLGMGHVVLPTKSLQATLAFYRDLLGFADTDHIRVPLTSEPDGPEAQVYFLHCNNPRHHSIGLTDMPQPAGAVHLMLEVNSIDDVGYALDRVKANRHHLSATLGRHTNDRVISFYVRSPGGFDIEFGWGGWQVDWSTYVPTISLKDSAWGHEWNFEGLGE